MASGFACQSSLPMAFKAFFIPGFLTFSTYAVNALLSMEPSPTLFQWRLQYVQGNGCVPVICMLRKRMGFGRRAVCGTPVVFQKSTLLPESKFCCTQIRIAHSHVRTLDKLLMLPGLSTFMVHKKA